MPGYGDIALMIIIVMVTIAIAISLIHRILYSLTLFSSLFFFSFLARDVVDYAEAITSKLRERGICSVNYSIATEHEHSCCVLLAREDKFKIKGRWHTWIDYDKFNTLISKFYESKKQIESGESNELFAFTSEDYMVETPEWAVYKNALNTKGFDPIESRWKRTKTGKMVEIDYKSSDSGCG